MNGAASKKWLSILTTFSLSLAKASRPLEPVMVAAAEQDQVRKVREDRRPR